MAAVKASAEAIYTVNCTVEEMDEWEDDFSAKESAFGRECAYFVCDVELTLQAKAAWSCNFDATGIYLIDFYHKI
eukprot:CAMPEP_0185759636 /NCGR_PEP_ID=MMETSP1174-20130828/18384_1 /TAXON_ID=35687 /ORGANISM="Dictyocha speculum, Strain CCMP1381" /LENGTH=74 /DNA_ID=CAMNT_0028440045 /DNA_START=731 /DNA_END=952 /DNA_ORIENTATION=-